MQWLLLLLPKPHKVENHISCIFVVVLSLPGFIAYDSKRESFFFFFSILHAFMSIVKLLRISLLISENI